MRHIRGKNVPIGSDAKRIGRIFVREGKTPATTDDINNNNFHLHQVHHSKNPLRSTTIVAKGSDLSHGGRHRGEQFEVHSPTGSKKMVDVDELAKILKRDQESDKKWGRR